MKHVDVAGYFKEPPKTFMFFNHQNKNTKSKWQVQDNARCKLVVFWVRTWNKLCSGVNKQQCEESRCYCGEVYILLVVGEWKYGER